MRVTSSVQRHKAHKKIFKAVKGFTHRRKNCYRIAKQAHEHVLLDNYIGRKLLKRDNKSLAIMRINAFCRSSGLDLNYSKFINLLKKKNLNMSRKTISELCVREPEAAINLCKFVTGK